MIALPPHDPPVLQSVRFPGQPEIAIDVLRLDAIHPVISGNKWFKLQGHWQRIPPACETVVTFGGAWSNHLIAAACAAQLSGIRSVGIVRGEAPPDLSPTLRAARDYGMRLEFIRRSDYAARNDPAFLAELSGRYPGAYIIPEGGGGPAGIYGCAGILRTADCSGYTHICCAVGTGAMFLGLALSARPEQRVVGIPVLKGVDPLTVPDACLLSPAQRARSQTLPGYHFEGYARHPERLLEFMNGLYRDTGIPTDIVYTGKLFFAIRDAVAHNFFPPTANLLLIHSGGLQGNRSLAPGTLQF